MLKWKKKKLFWDEFSWKAKHTKPSPFSNMFPPPANNFHTVPRMWHFVEPKHSFWQKIQKEIQQVTQSVLLPQDKSVYLST